MCRRSASSMQHSVQLRLTFGACHTARNTCDMQLKTKGWLQQVGGEIPIGTARHLKQALVCGNFGLCGCKLPFGLPAAS